MLIKSKNQPMCKIIPILCVIRFHLLVRIYILPDLTMVQEADFVVNICKKEQDQ